MSLDSLKQEASSLNTSPERLRELAAINDELARLVAANYCADSSLLEQLALKARTNKDTEIYKALASNPNTPTQWLIILAPKFPEEVFSNPVYSLLILEDVSFAHRFNQKMLLKLVCASNTSTSFLESAANVAEINIQRFRNDEIAQFSLQRQYEINLKRLRNDIGAWLGIYSFEDFWKWRTVLIAIVSHQNTSKKKC